MSRLPRRSAFVGSFKRNPLPMNRYRLLIVVSLFLISNLTFAQLGLGRVSNVAPLDGGCVLAISCLSTPSKAGRSNRPRPYAVTLTQVTDCANGGTDAAIEVVVKSSNTGNVCLTASKVATGTYVFSVTMPPMRAYLPHRLLHECVRWIERVRRQA